jgi:glycosyltransferase involved in cell wall biosynthesis
VIGSDSGAIPGVIGKAGMIFPEGDATALADDITRLQINPALCRRLREEGRARALAHFTHEQIAAATVEVYRALV